MTSVPVVSLVVSTIGRPSALSRLVDSLVDQVAPASQFELIVVDQSEDAACLQLLDLLKPRLRWRAMRSDLGVSLGRNVGAGVAQGRMLAFPDDDCWYHPSTITTAIAGAADGDEVIRSGQLLTEDGAAALLRWPRQPMMLDRTQVWRGALSSTMFMPTSVFHSLGGFDEDLGVGARTPWQAGEDTDLLLRAIAGGFRVRFEPALQVYHEEPDPTDGNQPAKMRRYGRGIGRVLATHRYPRRYVAALMTRKAAAFGVRLASGRRVRAKADLAWAQGLLQGYQDRCVA